ncbi:Myc-type, basic helix-loop-helix (bHLH) domain [Dillenia turbinata]|uniref:Myc-type, basic helix-loop-helix (BHLH) domain n=1 Tax=Dillenia turbinata TaxID=194707 RepID=A0AAN8UYX8_9MAGN
MTLEAVVFQQHPFNDGYKDISGLSNWGYGGFGFEEYQIPTSQLIISNNGSWDSSPSFMAQNGLDSEAPNSSSLEIGIFPLIQASPLPNYRRKRRRTKTCKNREEVENQRITHITVERNRRKQMNEYLSVLRSLMPSSYVQRGDQASIVGGAIDFVKELEQLLQSLEAQKRKNKQNPNSSSSDFPSLFSDFFTFPQYSTCSKHYDNCGSGNESMGEKRSGIADVEVTMVERHANLKILSRRKPRQLLKMVNGFHSLRLTILHLNVTTVHQLVLYTLSVKVEDDCQLTSVNEIATAVYEMVDRIQEEALVS